MRLTFGLLVPIAALLLVLLQYKLWVGEGGLTEVWNLHGAVQAQRTENERLRERNEALRAEVRDLKKGLEAVEERARRELGMIREDETFYRVVEPREDAVAGE